MSRAFFRAFECRCRHVRFSPLFALSARTLSAEILPVIIGRRQPQPDISFSRLQLEGMFSALQAED